MIPTASAIRTKAIPATRIKTQGLKLYGGDLPSPTTNTTQPYSTTKSHHKLPTTLQPHVSLPRYTLQIRILSTLGILVRLGSSSSDHRNHQRLSAWPTMDLHFSRRGVSASYLTSRIRIPPTSTQKGCEDKPTGHSPTSFSTNC